jgi:hypothetical protein
MHYVALVTLLGCPRDTEIRVASPGFGNFALPFYAAALVVIVSNP